MSTVAVYDYDFLHYQHVLPNLECAKLISYFRKTNHICVFVPEINTAMYKDTYARKEYDDGIFPRNFFQDGVTYGGRAFSPNKYTELSPEIEYVVPDMHIYDKFVECYGPTKTDQVQIKRILNAAHLRLAPDSKHLVDEKYALKCLEGTSGLILHDYDLAAVEGAEEFLFELSNSRKHVGFKFRGSAWPYPIGNKYPIRVSSESQFEKWHKLEIMPGLLLFEYCGLLNNDQLLKLIENNKRFQSQLYYNIAAGCSGENDFLINRAPQIFLQTLFLRRHNIKILLTYDNEFFITEELRNFVELLNCFMSMPWQDNMLQGTQTLYQFVRRNAKYHYTNWSFKHVTITTQESRNLFQYIREHNYELFKMFYELDAIIYEKGELVNEWHRNQNKS